jgi:hypothetical protein
VLTVFNNKPTQVLTFPESRCEYIHFLRVYVFASPINMKKTQYCGLPGYGAVYSGTVREYRQPGGAYMALSSGERYMMALNFINLLSF